MGRPVKESLRLFSKPEEQELQRVVKATSERVDSVRRAKALLAVAVGKSRTAARTDALTPLGWLRGSYSGLQSNCRLTH